MTESRNIYTKNAAFYGSVYFFRKDVIFYHLVISTGYKRNDIHASGGNKVEIATG